MSRTLIAYFSASGETKTLAKTIAAAAEGDLFEIIPKQPYTSADLNWNNPKSRSSLEMNDHRCRPAITSHVENMEQYETVFVGFPIWWYQAPRIIESFLESYDFSGKTIIPFATSGGSGMGKTESILQKLCPVGTKWLPGKRLSSHESAERVRMWIDGLKR